MAQVITAIAIFMLGQLGVMIWFMSGLNVTVNIKFESLTKSMDAITKALAAAYNKDDALREIGRVEAKADTAHKRIDFHLQEHEHKCATA